MGIDLWWDTNEDLNFKRIKGSAIECLGLILDTNMEPPPKDLFV